MIDALLKLLVPHSNDRCGTLRILISRFEMPNVRMNKRGTGHGTCPKIKINLKAQADPKDNEMIRASECLASKQGLRCP